MPTRQARAKYARGSALGRGVLWTHGEIVDFVGPLVRNGNIANLVVVDAFSRFVFLSRAQNHGLGGFGLFGAEFFPAFGTPKFVVTDKVRVFCCRLFRDLCFRWGVKHLTTTPYYLQASLAERVNRNLKSALTVFTTLVRKYGMKIYRG
jgi:hypothetical protein